MFDEDMRDSSWILRKEELPRHGIILISIGFILQHVGGVSIQSSIKVCICCVLHMQDDLSLADDHLLHWQFLTTLFDPRNDDV